MSLDLDRRAVLALAAIEGLGPVEIAEVLGVPLGTVHSGLSRADPHARTAGPDRGLTGG